MSVRSTLWPLEDHTRGKHLVLQHYLHAWLPILGTTRGRIVFIDGFAGPGQYATGEFGSPVIALDAFTGHGSQTRMRDVRFLFVEERPDRADHLRALLAERYAALPANATYSVVCGQCAATVGGLLGDLEARGQQLAPSLMMLDPFGVEGLPMHLVRRFLAYEATEVYVSLMYEPIRRFYETPEFAPHLDELFGTSSWRATMACCRTDPERARLATYALYEQQLRAAGATYVLHFDLYTGARLMYSIFFATKHARGCDRMKQAIWRAMPDGAFRFRGARHREQMALELPAVPDFSRLQRDLLVAMADGEWIPIERLEQFMASDQTPFHTGNFKRNGLKVLETDGKIEVQRRPGGRRGTFPEGTLIRATAGAA